ncbi:programmed cell death protein 2 [Scheffersomyces coipomensis]|uniref:programmed cell death protein 2 n=1 Tax=Scheffersomyces coipomensis TaxID=1788519 RepID=UPI00315D7E83
MSSHDEYSSDEEDDDLIGNNDTSEVYLGFVDAPIIDDEEDPEDNELPTIEDTFIGSKPIWLHPKSQPEESAITCDNCHKKMALLLQAFAPMDGKLYDRVIYIFGCKNSSQCSRTKGSVKAIRGISRDPERVAEIKSEQDSAIQKALDEKLKLEDQRKFNIEVTKDLFTKTNTNSSNPFGESSTSNPFAAASNPFAKKEEPKKEEPKKEEPIKESYAKIASKNAPKPQKKKISTISNDDLPAYNGSFVYVDLEKFKKEGLDPELEKYKHLIEKSEKGEESDSEEGPSNGGRGASKRRESSSGASIEASSVLDDRYFAAFTDKVKHNPGQVLRYNLGGRPLLYSGKDDIAKRFIGTFNIPKPGFNPGSERQFELQLMPKAIMDLEQIDETNANIADILNGMSWGTIIVGTDVEDFIPEENFDEHHVAYIEEWCGVQWEESV